MRKLLIFILVTIFLAACRPSPPPLTLYNWTYDDLVALDPADSARPDLDLIAIYLRADRRELQFRLDFLDLDLFPAYDLYLALDLAPGGTHILPLDTSTVLEWDALVTIPANGQPAVLAPNLRPRADLIPRVVRDPDLDMVIISLVQPALGAEPKALRADIFLAPAGERSPADEIGPAGAATPRPGRAPALLAFWNTFPAYSPAQALRRWDGAHTGPFGERHGLSQLLNAASAYKVPITLLDTKNPLALSALEYLGALTMIRSLADIGLLTLPDAIPLPHQAASGDLPFVPPSAALVRSATTSRQVSTALGLPASPWLYAPLVPPELPAAYQGLFIPLSGKSNPAPAQVFSLARSEGRVVIPLPDAVDPLQATPDGLSLPVREELLRLALTGYSESDLADTSIVFLGGDLPSSAWGDPQASRAALQYIAGHPWIWPLSGQDLMSANPRLPITPPPPPTLPEVVPNTIDGAPIPSGQTVDQIQTEILQALDRAPPGPARDLAWSAYFSLLAPNPPAGERLAAVRAGYLGQVGAILAAARWATDPQPAASCMVDLDFDGQPECLLANENIFTIFEPEGARLTFGFVRTANGLAQWVAPQSQFLVGWSDPSEWDPSRGAAGDPADIPGAFTDTRARWARYAVTAVPGGLRFSAPAEGMIKTFTLTIAGIRALVQSEGSGRYTLQIPLALNPEIRFTPGWGERYQVAVLPDGFTWQIDEEIIVSLSTTGRVSLMTFTDSLGNLAGPEDPNFDYPAGHYLPFPLAVATISAENDLEIEVQVGVP